MKPNQEEKDLLSYLEGEIKYEPMGEQIWAIDGEKHTLIADVRGYGRISRMFKNEREAIKFQDALGEFIATALINERERRKVLQKPSCTCTKGKGTDFDEDGHEYCIDCQRWI